MIMSTKKKEIQNVTLVMHSAVRNDKRTQVHHEFLNLEKNYIKNQYLQEKSSIGKKDHTLYCFPGP